MPHPTTVVEVVLWFSVEPKIFIIQTIFRDISPNIDMTHCNLLVSTNTKKKVFYTFKYYRFKSKEYVTINYQ